MSFMPDANTYINAKLMRETKPNNVKNAKINKCRTRKISPAGEKKYMVRKEL